MGRVLADENTETGEGRNAKSPGELTGEQENMVGADVCYS